MLEEKKYKKEELSIMFGTKSVNGLKKKLNRYDVMFSVEGRGEKTVFDIKKIRDPFKIYCITELDFSANTDFKKLRYFYYYFFNDEEFAAMPDEVKESRMMEKGKPVSRQTIATYLRKLEQKSFIVTCSTECIYYFAHKGKQRIVDKKEYATAWREYWDLKNGGADTYYAIAKMIEKYGGVARKQPIPMKGAFHLKDLDYMMTLIHKSFENEF